MSLRLLGPVELRREGVMLPVRAAKKRMILAVLGLRSGEVVSTDRLIDAVWGERPSPSAGKALQVYVSQLRDIVEPVRRAPSVIVSQAPGYALALPPQAVDMRVFERLWSEGRRLRASQDTAAAARVFSRALSLWRGPPLADLTYENAFAQDVVRLEEMRWSCLEDRADAELASGRHIEVIADLEDLARHHPLRERACGLLMVAYYRSGRQADALSAYRRTRAKLVGELGLEPSRVLVELERQVLQHDPALDTPVGREGPSGPPGTGSPMRTILAVAETAAGLDSLLPVAAPLAKATGAEVVLVAVLPPASGQTADDDLPKVTQELVDRRGRLADDAVTARVAAFSTPTPGSDLRKFAFHQDVAMILVDATMSLASRRPMISELLLSAACDVVLSFPRADLHPRAGLLVPFGGEEHDWAAVELAAHLARQRNAPLLLAGAVSSERADPSRMLATASLIVQRTVGVTAEPVLIAPGAAGVLNGARRAGLIVLGVSARYRTDGLGEMRQTIVREATAPTLVVRHGRRPSILAPPDSLTQFGWSISA